jgi:hypothetical protein
MESNLRRGPKTLPKHRLEVLFAGPELHSVTFMLGTHQLHWIPVTMTIKAAFLSLLWVLSVTAWMLARGSDSIPEAKGPTPVLVELFTSEGCSSCPPADRFLEELDGQPVPGAEVIVLSEHVDYWNHLGWKDPYSARIYSERQSAYAKRLGGGVYTPQMVVDGTSEFVGSSPELANKAFAKAFRIPKIPAHLRSISVDTSNTLHARLEIGNLGASFAARETEVYVAVALNRAKSRVSTGENSGHILTHVSVVRSLTKIGSLKQGEFLAQDIHLKLEPGSDSHNLRLIAFVQEPGQGRVLGATSMPVSPQ